MVTGFLGPTGVGGRPHARASGCTAKQVRDGEAQVIDGGVAAVCFVRFLTSIIDELHPASVAVQGQSSASRTCTWSSQSPQASATSIEHGVPDTNTSQHGRSRTTTVSVAATARTGPREQNAHTTATYEYLRTPTGSLSVPAKAGPEQDPRLKPPIRPDLTRSAHNPKVAGSNPAPATTKPLVDGNIRQGLVASRPKLLTVLLTGCALALVRKSRPLTEFRRRRALPRWRQSVGTRCSDEGRVGIPVANLQGVC